ncbi:MAG TPA: hypothetical protein VGJ84_17345, partial [Polyangiaceae bacterium]
MLVLLGPPFEGTEEEYQTLAGTTGLVVYDLKTKLKPGAWGLVRVLADQEQANDLGTRLSAAGFRIAVIDHDIAHDPARTVVALRSIELNRDHMVLHLRERSMPVPYQALLTIVRGEVQLGRNYGRSSGTSGASFRAVVSPVDAAALRESAAVAPLDAFAAADLHFATVFWVARIDARHFDFSALGNPAQSG